MFHIYYADNFHDIIEARKQNLVSKFVAVQRLNENQKIAL